MSELDKARDVTQYRTDFRSTLPHYGVSYQ